MTEIITPQTAERYLRPHEVAYLRNLVGHIKGVKHGPPPYLQAEVRSYLQQHRDGKTVREIALETGRGEKTIRHALQKMPDAWIERYIKNGVTRPVAVWRVVPPKGKHDQANN